MMTEQLDVLTWGHPLRNEEKSSGRKADAIRTYLMIYVRVDPQLCGLDGPVDQTGPIRETRHDPEYRQSPLRAMEHHVMLPSQP